MVVVVDSGISSAVSGMESWVVGRESVVAPPYRNEDHGTFVAGLICWGDILNPNVAGIDSGPCAVFDLQVLPNGDPAKGSVDNLTEQELLGTLEDALRRHANDFKVWNLSLGTDSVCSLDEFSSFAEELDNLQERYQVSFVISAGNYTTRPLLGFPRAGPEIDAGRITTPADSVLGITVGSLSHVDYTGAGPNSDEPAPYSRHGAGPNYVIKPDLMHYGGSCTVDGGQTRGVRSVCSGACAEDMGTSFAAPLVSKTLAQIYHRVTPTPSPVLARALLTHHARDPRTNLRVPDGQEDFFGFGLPTPAPYCLECTLSAATLVFDDVLRPGFDLEWDYFPYPESLTRDGKFFGEVWMTVAFAPARGSRWGSEYCESHIEAHFGVYRDRVNQETGEITTYFEGLVPPEHKNPGVLYESYQVSALRKWAPVRTYHGDLGARGKSGDRWRLKVSLLNRHGAEVKGDQYRPQPFSLVVTIADPGGAAPVYDEMARSLKSRFQAQNLTLRSAARVTRFV
ncbi:MAG: S8 family peptidase [Actinobacteria bacterium]|nr:S8 family peptidase [Actinomycetota bacterium]